jgi:alpha-ribazole phosphatase
MVSRLFLLRHGRTDLTGRLAGSMDVDLNSVGIQQVQSLRPVLAREGFKKVFCSPMRRCRETARLLDLHTDIIHTEDIREIDFGLWEGKDFSEIEKNHPKKVRDWIEDPEGFCFPEGECRADFILRVERFKTMLQGLPDEKVLIISHGGVIRHLICSYLGLSFEKYLLFNIHEAQFSIVECFSEGGVLTGLNKGGG